MVSHRQAPSDPYPTAYKPHPGHKLAPFEVAAEPVQKTRQLPDLLELVLVQQLQLAFFPSAFTSFAGSCL